MGSIFKCLGKKSEVAVKGYRLLREDKDGYWFINDNDYVLLVSKYEATYVEFAFVNLMVEITEGTISTEDLKAIHAVIH
jgi:hypothetical protein